MALTCPPDSPQPHPRSPSSSQPFSPSLGGDLLGARLTWFSLAQQPWLELPFQQVSLGSHQLTHCPERAGCWSRGVKKQLRSCVWLLELPPPVVFQWMVTLLFSSPWWLLFVQGDSGGWVMFTVLSALCWGLPEDTSPQPLFSRRRPLLVTNGLRPLTAIFERPWGSGDKPGAICLQSLAHRWLG